MRTAGNEIPQIVKCAVSVFRDIVTWTSVLREKGLSIGSMRHEVDFSAVERPRVTSRSVTISATENARDREAS